ncbi:MAG: hypothetical protein LBN21_02670 [Treponema sp.]|jgi:hypothetical protein|nr:hypothetical protein [Treponema sp.]
MAKIIDKSPDDFWREYEQQIGEKVLARNMGQYLSGWEEFESDKTGPLWGLLIATDGGFRFHHFPQTNWMSAILRVGSGPASQQERTLFIPIGQIVSAEFIIEKKWWKKIFAPTQPQLVIRYRNVDGAEKELHAETESRGGELAEILTEMAAKNT